MIDDSTIMLVNHWVTDFNNDTVDDLVDVLIVIAILLLWNDAVTVCNPLNFSACQNLATRGGHVKGDVIQI